MDGNRMNLVSRRSPPEPSGALIDQWAALTTEYLKRATSQRALLAIEDSIGSMFLTSHLVCRFVGDPEAMIGATMNLNQLAQRLRTEMKGICAAQALPCSIETFGDAAPLVADSRWLVAMWSLLLDMATTMTHGTRIEANMGTCGNRFEFEVGHDELTRTSHPDPVPAAAFPSPVTRAWIDGICPEWEIVVPACPLGGRAVQIRIPRARSMARAA